MALNATAHRNVGYTVVLTPFSLKLRYDCKSNQIKIITNIISTELVEILGVLILVIIKGSASGRNDELV